MQVATDFVMMGWRVGVAARREGPLKELKAKCPENVEYLSLDVTADDAGQKFDELVALTGGMDILLYSAGTGMVNPELETADDLRTAGVNVTGFTKIINAAYRHFKTASPPSGGQIAAITSVAATKGIGIAASYSATKRYQVTYLQAIAQLASIQHVDLCVTDIRPGFVSTDLLNGGRSYPMLMDVRYAARLIERAILRRRRVAVIDTRWSVLTALWSAIPDKIWRKLHIKFKD